ncbi:MAG: hypothetical protein U0790_13680 [Isosphaeraceae bacterium]
MKTLLKAVGMVACLGLGTVLVSGCNPDEPAKTTTPPPTPPAAVKAAPKADAPKAPEAKPAPPKAEEKK